MPERDALGTTGFDVHDTNARSSDRTRLRINFATITAHPLFSYGTILLLQLRVVWWFWSGRDLSAGDTAGYFTQARDWATSFHGAIFWSPLYTFYYGAVLRIFKDPATATT